MFRHVGIVVNNLEKMIWFYQDFLRMEIVYDKIEEGFFLNHILNSQNLAPRIVKLSFEKKVVVELLFFNQKKSLKTKSLTNNGLTHFALTVQNVDSLYEKFLENDLVVVNKPLISEENKVKVFFGRDPENNLIEFVELI
jgi:catechol 2,3-dioxygenase-like lactoylglutathione lyase family enzyme